MGIIDSHSEHSLYDVLNGDLSLDFDDEGMPQGGRYEFYGFHIVPTNESGGTYSVQYDGHVGRIGTIQSEDYDDVLELVDELMTYVFEAHHFDYQDDKEELVEWAGKIMTSEKEKAEQHPDLYMHIPER